MKMVSKWLAIRYKQFLSKRHNVSRSDLVGEATIVDRAPAETISSDPARIDDNIFVSSSIFADETEVDPIAVCKALFDVDWYLSQSPDLGVISDPLLHYLEVGYKQHLNPHPLFITGWYTVHYPEVLEAGMNPLLHYILHGGQEGRTPHPLFDPDWYRKQDVSLERSNVNLLLHYLDKGHLAGLDPNPLFETTWYSANSPDSETHQLSALEHYVQFGAREGRDPGPNFSSKMYIGLNRAAKRADLDPLSHYLIYGFKSGRPQLPPQCNAKIAVVFLARSETGSSFGMDTFAKSYKKYTSGVAHDLIVLRKGGMRKSGAALALELMLEGCNPQYVDIEDDGYDIQAYLNITPLLRNEYVCFLNTHSEILADDWLKKLYTPLISETVGVTAATASYESIYDSVCLECKAVWATEVHGIPYDETLAHELGTHLRKHSPVWMRQAQEILEELEPRRDDPSIMDLDRSLAFSKHWNTLTSLGGPLYAMDRFNRFPNPHIRSNAFMLKRELLESLKFEIDDTKLACIEFESGPRGLPARLQEKRLDAVLVGANGDVYSVEQWPYSNTFRLGSQDNVLIADNRVREYETFDDNEKARLKIMSWGEYLGPVPDAYRQLGFPFAKGSLRQFTQQKAEKGSLENLKISVVIPTHNRVALVKDALFTILQQEFRNWECVVFDNASTEPLAEHVASLREDRVRYARSERFLPVTESWNEAIDRATGDYVILLGDDDGLIPNSLSRLLDIVVNFDQPDMVYSSLYQFFHPGVAPWEPSGSVTELRYGTFFSGRQDEFLLDRQSAKSAVTASLQFRRCFTFNMQAFFFKRTFLELIRRNDRIFHSPFPDYYLANVTFQQAAKIVVAPKPLTIAGVSRKSYGFTLFNDQEKKGDALLNTAFGLDPLFAEVEPSLLPGPTYNTNYLLTMYHVAHAIGFTPDTVVRSDRYRKIQIWHALGGSVTLMSGQPAAGDEIHLSLRLTQQEIDWTRHLSFLGSRVRSGDENARAELSRLAEEVTMYAPAHLAVNSKTVAVGDYANLPELFSALETRPF